jgi:ubiquinone/menaquinone biosynthesis C-methylase UbiE
MRLKKFKNWNNFYKKHKGNKYPDNFIIIMLLQEFKNLCFSERKKINILDLGMGGGANLFFLHNENFKTFGIDFSKKTHDVVKKKITRLKLDIDLKCADFTSLPYDDLKFDAVIDCRSLQHKQNYLLDQSLKEIKRVLKKNGKFFSIFMNYEDQKSGFYTNYLTKKEIKKNLSRYFNVLEFGFLKFSFSSSTKPQQSFWISRSIKKGL